MIYVLPTGLFKKSFRLHDSVLLQMVNMSLRSGVFPQAMKTAAIKPLLKKDKVDKSVLMSSNQDLACITETALVQLQ